MKNLILTPLLCLAVLGCVQPSHQNPGDNGNSNSGSTSVSPGRNELIEALKRLHKTVSSNNTEQIASLFSFPLPDSLFSIYVDDSTFNGKRAENGGLITRDMFLQNFHEIFNVIQVDRVDSLFRYLNVDSLARQDTISEDAYVKKDPCFYNYEIAVEGDKVTLFLNMKSNSDYESKSKNEDEVPENDSSNCEHNFWWIFKFDGHDLHLVGISGAD